MPTGCRLEVRGGVHRVAGRMSRRLMEMTGLANSLQAEVPALFTLAKVRKSAGEKISFGPSEFLESRTATTSGRF